MSSEEKKVLGDVSPIVLSSSESMHQTQNYEVHMKREFNIWSLLALSWNMVNVCGGLSYIFVVGFSAGGLPTILYGFICSSACVFCLMAVLAECASIYATAGGAYHFATFLTPEKYRRYVAYPIGWLNYVGWVLVLCACLAIMSGVTFSLVNLLDPDFVNFARYQLYLVYVGWGAVAWAASIWALGAMTLAETFVCWFSIAAFLSFSVAMLALAPKAEAAFVFKDVVNVTGYDATSMAVILGLYNTMVAYGCLDTPCHLAEEISNPKQVIPKILYWIIIVQTFVGTAWILVIGFCISDIDAIITSPTGVPIVEVVRLAFKSDAAAIVFNVVLIIIYSAATIGAMITASRQGFALARDGGMYYNSYLSKIDPKIKLPIGSINVVFVASVLIGLLYLGSTTGFNAILGASASFGTLSFASPALMMIIFGRKQLPKTPYSLGKFGYPFCFVTVVFALLLFVIVLIPSVQPITAANFNYTILIVVVFAVSMVVTWFLGARESFRPPSYTESVGWTIAGDDTEGEM